MVIIMEKIVCLVLALAIGLNGCSLKKEDEYQDRIVNGIINKDADEIMECFCDELDINKGVRHCVGIVNKFPERCGKAAFFQNRALIS